MRTSVKICGLTRPADAAAAARFGAAYAGVILAGGPRNVSREDAAKIFAAIPRESSTRRVVVISALNPAGAAALAREVAADVIQMHSDPSAADVRELRSHWKGDIWPVARAADVANPDQLVQLMAVGDALVVDSGSRGSSGGTGRVFEWETFPFPRRTDVGHRLVLAGGLTSANVQAAIRVVRPNVVDVSSGVESAPGLKDHDRIRDFIERVLSINGEGIVDISS